MLFKLYSFNVSSYKKKICLRFIKKSVPRCSEGNCVSFLIQNSITLGNIPASHLTWYLLRILETHPWDTRSWREMTQGLTPAAAISTIFSRMWLGRGRPLMNSPPNWFTRPCPKKIGRRVYILEKFIKFSIMGIEFFVCNLGCLLYPL